MLKLSSIVVKTLTKRQCSTQRFLRPNKLIDVSSEVSDSLLNNKPIVALESTIITHGMPYPINYQCALAVEEIIRNEGAIPATIAIINGRIKVGLNEEELKLLSDTNKNKSVKTSRRDFPYVLANKLNGGTTVSGTIIIANYLGIPVFVTGGIGGVHRFGETTLDVSADLTELGRNNIAVISSGVKSILDIPKTLEYLETQGVLVSVFGETKQFPAFYSRESGCNAPYNVISPYEAAKLIKASQELELKSGMLFAVPIPEQYALDSKQMEESIQKCLKLAKENKIEGKFVTPFLLEYMSKVTKGKSLESNIALIKNNAKTGAQISIELSKLKTDTVTSNTPVIIGGAIQDFNATIHEKEIIFDSATHKATIYSSGGGVARNICEAMVRLGAAPKFISAVGQDVSASVLENITSVDAFETVVKTTKFNTAQFFLLCDQTGECKIGLGDLEIFKLITPEVVRSHEELIKTSPLLILDSNLELETITEALNIATKYKIPVFYEPTDPAKAERIFETNNYSSVKLISPNLLELQKIANYFSVPYDFGDDTVASVSKVCDKLSEKLDMTIIVTLGSLGVLVASRRQADVSYFKEKQFVSGNGKLLKRHYRAPKVEKIVNFNGAGDCWISGFMAGVLDGLTEEQAVEVGFKASRKALRSKSAVPNDMFKLSDVDATIKARYELIL